MISVQDEILRIFMTSAQDETPEAISDFYTGRDLETICDSWTVRGMKLFMTSGENEIL